jgi:hypothetical protein
MSALGANRTAGMAGNDVNEPNRTKQERTSGSFASELHVGEHAHPAPGQQEIIRYAS